jgi:hypothetical protein
MITKAPGFDWPHRFSLHFGARFLIHPLSLLHARSYLRFLPYTRSSVFSLSKSLVQSRVNREISSVTSARSCSRLLDLYRQG